MGDPEIVDEQVPAESAGEASGQLLKLVSKVIDSGLGPLTGSVTWAEDRLARVQGADYVPIDAPSRPVNPESQEDIDKVIKKLIAESVQAASVNGFVTGLGGFVSMPVSVPANMAGTIVINARLAGAIAYLRGYEPQDPHVRTVATLVAVGSNSQQIAKTVGVRVGHKFAMQAIRRLPMSVVHQINKRAGFMLLAKYGTRRSAVTLAKAVPLVGGLVGGAVDATMTTVVGQTAKKMFPAS